MKRKLAFGHCFFAKDLFQNFPLSKLTMTKELCLKEYPDGNKRDLAASIFMKSAEIVIDDIIENNTQFKLPGIGQTQSYILMKRTTGEDFKQAFKNGKWRDVDFIKSDFSGNSLCFIMLSLKRTAREKPIYLSKEKTDKITKYTNAGKLY